MASGEHPRVATGALQRPMEAALLTIVVAPGAAIRVSRAAVGLQALAARLTALAQLLLSATSRP